MPSCGPNSRIVLKSSPERIGLGRNVGLVWGSFLRAGGWRSGFDSDLAEVLASIGGLHRAGLQQKSSVLSVGLPLAGRV